MYISGFFALRALARKREEQAKSDEINEQRD
jgi:hypothetical protein